MRVLPRVRVHVPRRNRLSGAGSGAARSSGSRQVTAWWVASLVSHTCSAGCGAFLASRISALPASAQTLSGEQEILLDGERWHGVTGNRPSSESGPRAPLNVSNVGALLSGDMFLGEL